VQQLKLPSDGMHVKERSCSQRQHRLRCRQTRRTRWTRQEQRGVDAQEMFMRLGIKADIDGDGAADKAISACRPDGQFMAIWIEEMEAPSTGERIDGFDDRRAGTFQPRLSFFEIVGIEDD
jgi:hypothetical protein